MSFWRPFVCSTEVLEAPRARHPLRPRRLRNFRVRPGIAVLYDLAWSRSMHISFWIIFNAVILLLLFLDLTVWNRGGRIIPFQQALLSSGFWIALALGFAVLVHHWLGPTKALEFVTGYLVEEALSVDNLFVFILIFSYFKVPP